jgi:hypothetical protein
MILKITRDGSLTVRAFSVKKKSKIAMVSIIRFVLFDFPKESCTKQPLNVAQE